MEEKIMIKIMTQAVLSFLVTFLLRMRPMEEKIMIKIMETDFFPKIISPSAGENSGDLA